MARFQDCVVDPGLVARAKRGDTRAHEILYRTFSVPVYSLARRMMRRPDVADEVLQETFVEVIRKIGSFRGEAPINAWIRRIAVNKCLMHQRSAWSRYARTLEPHHEERGGGGSSADIGPGVQAHVDLAAALGELSDTARTVIWLYDVEGYTHREIGELMGMTESFSKSQLARAHKRLRDLLEQEHTSEQCMQASNNC